MKELKWPAVVVIIVLILVLGYLSYYGKDATTVLAGIIAVLGALGFGYQFSKQSEIQASNAKIEEQTNGRMSQMAELMEKVLHVQQATSERHRQDMKEMVDKMAVMSPIPTDLPVSGGGAPHSPNL